MPPPAKRPKYKQHTIHNFFGIKKSHDTNQQHSHIRQDQAALLALDPSPAPLPVTAPAQASTLALDPYRALVPAPASTQVPTPAPAHATATAADKAPTPAPFPAPVQSPVQASTQATDTALDPAPAPPPATATAQAPAQAQATLQVPVDKLRAILLLEGDQSPAPAQATTHPTDTGLDPAPTTTAHHDKCAPSFHQQGTAQSLDNRPSHNDYTQVVYKKPRQRMVIGVQGLVPGTTQGMIPTNGPSATPQDAPPDPNAPALSTQSTNASSLPTTNNRGPHIDTHVPQVEDIFEDVPDMTPTDDPITSPSHQATGPPPLQDLLHAVANPNGSTGETTSEPRTLLHLRLRQTIHAASHILDADDATEQQTRLQAAPATFQNDIGVFLQLLSSSLNTVSTAIAASPPPPLPLAATTHPADSDMSDFPPPDSDDEPTTSATPPPMAPVHRLTAPGQAPAQGLASSPAPPTWSSTTPTQSPHSALGPNQAIAPPPTPAPATNQAPTQPPNIRKRPRPPSQRPRHSKTRTRPRSCTNAQPPANLTTLHPHIPLPATTEPNAPATTRMPKPKKARKKPAAKADSETLRQLRICFPLMAATTTEPPTSPPPSTSATPPIESDTDKNLRLKAGKAARFKVQFSDMTCNKQEGTARICFGNMGPGGLQPHCDGSIQSLRTFLQRWQVDHYGGCEHQMNLDNIPPYHRLHEIFRSENALRCIAAHNKHSNDHNFRQQGGTMSMTMGEMASRHHTSGKDATGLGRWVWQLFKGKNNITTRIYTAYRPCKTHPKQLKTVYNLQRAYFRDKGIDRCPRELFLEDLEKELQGRKMAGERLLVMMDANDDVSTGAIRCLAEAVGLRDAILNHHPDLPPPATHRDGSKTIDVILASPELQVLQAAFLAGDKSPGDHRWGLVDIKYEVLIGEDLIKVVRPQARRLTCGLPAVKQAYNKRFLKLAKQHQLLPKLYQIQRERYKDSPLSTDLSARMTQIDRVREQIMKSAEKKSRKLHMGAVSFSPKIAMAGKKFDLCKLIWKKKKGLHVKSTRIRRLAQQLRIPKPLSVTLEQAYDNFKEALAIYKGYKPDSSVLRYAFLTEKRDDPHESEESRKAATRLIHKENARKLSRSLQQIKNLPRCGAISKVEIPDPDDANGPTTIYDTQETIEPAIMATIKERYQLAHKSPFLHERLLSIIGLTGTDDESAAQFLNGTFVCPEGVDETTKLIIELLKKPFHGWERIDASISRGDYQRYFKKVKESTSSAISGIHFGHWKAGAYCDHASEIHSIFTEIAATSGYVPPGGLLVSRSCWRKNQGSYWLTSCEPSSYLKATLTLPTNCYWAAG